MQWYNSRTDELQSEKPGNTIVFQAYWESLYSDWAQVADDFRPPMPVLTKEQLLKNLDKEYQPKFASLAQSIGLATLNGDQPVINSIKSDYAALKAQYQVKKEGIVNG